MHSGSRSSPHAGPHLITRRRFLTSASLAGLGVAAYASTHGRHQFEIVHRTFAIANLPDAFQNFRIVQISDIHLEEYTETWFLEEIVRQTNALQPDLVLITGDFVSYGPRALPVAWRAAGTCAEVLSGLSAPQRYAVLGNHDHGVGAHLVTSALQSSGITVLRNACTPIERGSSRFWIAGVEDPLAGHPMPELAIPASIRNVPNEPVVLLCHGPDFADNLLREPCGQAVDFMLSGHSHGLPERALPSFGCLHLCDFTCGRPLERSDEPPL